jgi:serine/threonine protein kinase
VGRGPIIREVYRARDTKLHRDVALKILPEVLARDGERVARFAREARLLTLLNHPHIAAVYGLEESGGRTFLVMELAPGGTLADRIAGGPLPPGEALAIALQIADALDASGFLIIVTSISHRRYLVVDQENRPALRSAAPRADRHGRPGGPEPKPRPSPPR